MMHMTSSNANMARMSQSISRSTLLRLLGGSVAFIITCTYTMPMMGSFDNLPTSLPVSVMFQEPCRSVAAGPRAVKA